MKIKGRTVLITGGAKRIGKTIAFEFAKQGANILLHYNKSKDEALQTQSEIHNLNVKCDLISFDFTHEDAFESVLNKQKVLLSNVSILINSASIFYPTSIEELTGKDWDPFIQTHLKGPQELSKRVGLSLKEKNDTGLIINITDVSLLKPAKDYLPYNCSKAALEQMTKLLAAELAPNVRVNAIAPGAILFPESHNEEQQKNIIAKVPLRKKGDPLDIANACIFLAENDYLDGITLHVDGGRHLAG